NAIYTLNLYVSTGYSIQYNREPSGHNDVLAQAGFTNLLFENFPVVRADICPHKYLIALNDNYMAFAVSPRADFYLRDFEQPTNQDAFVSTLLWAGNLMCMNSRAQAAFTNLSF